MAEGVRVSTWLKNASSLVGLGVIAILIVMIVPLPPVLLDILLSLNITMAIIILLISMYVLRPLDFSVFPSILLLATLFRLALNVASTRLILLYGNEGTDAAGKVIQAFGTFVVGGNYVVGFIVFLVLVIINFVVITKGATRIAEVAARFTLDAMPGKQMSIDADLNSGLINDQEARRRRAEIEKEANFYGAMDGASKFVRGDAIAGIIITLVNIIGGLIVGVIQKGMPPVDAATNYTLLTVGDGLVTQVPALIISTAAGILVTRSAASTELGEEIRKQLFVHPMAVATTATMLVIFALIPGMPKGAFLLVATVFGFFALRLFTSARRAEPVKEEVSRLPAVEPTIRVIPVDPIGLEVGYGLISLVDATQGGELLARIKALRKQLAQEMGFVLPAVHIRDNLQLRPNEYAVLLKGETVAKGEVMPHHFLTITTEDQQGVVKGIETREPAFGLPAVWITQAEKDNVQARGFVVVDPATVITTHLTEIIKSHADELLGRQELQAILDGASANYPKLIEELVPKVIPINILLKVFQRLLKERIPVRDIVTILETLENYITITKNVDILTGYVRQALARSITKQYQDQEGNINVMVISPEIEDKISRAVQHTEFESFVSPDPYMVKAMIENIKKMMDQFVRLGHQPVFLCSPNVRIYLRKILENYFTNPIVLSHNEITREANIRSLGMVEL